MKILTDRSRSLTTRITAALWAASFLFFLIYSAPHQVHHSFEQLPKAHHRDRGHEHPKHGTDHGSSAETKCVFQLSASRCHAAVVWEIASISLPLSVGPLALFELSTGHSTDLTATFTSALLPQA